MEQIICQDCIDHPVVAVLDNREPMCEHCCNEYLTRNSSKYSVTVYVNTVATYPCFEMALAHVKSLKGADYRDSGITGDDFVDCEYDSEGPFNYVDGLAEYERDALNG